MSKMRPSAPTAVFDGPLFAEDYSDADLETLRVFGVEAALVAASPLPVASAGEARARLEALLTVQLPRLERAGIRTWATLGLLPSSLPEKGLHEVLDALPDLCAKGRAVAIGPLRLVGQGEGPEEAFDEQLALADRLELPLLIDASGAALGPTVARLQASGLSGRRVLMLGLDETSARIALSCGYYAGLRLEPRVEPALAAVRRLGAKRVVLGGRVGVGGDLLALPRAVHRLEQEGLSEALVARVSGQNLAGLLRVPAV